MGNTTTASVTGAQVAPAKSAVKDLPIAKVWAFAVGQFGWALLSGIISNWLVYFYPPDQETISQGQTVFVPQGLVVLGIVTVVGGITAFARFFDAFVDPAVASGPLITTVNDLIAVVTYYGLAEGLLRGVLGG